MLITPNLRTWPSVERGQENNDWSDIADARPAIAAFAARTGLALPADYRAVMERFNGGRIYPNLLRHPVPADVYVSSEPVTILDPLHSWEHVEKVWDGQVFGRGCPPGMLNVASDPGRLEVLLSLRPEDHGRVFAWMHTRNIWGTDGNDIVYPLADSFTALLAGLFDDAERTGHAYWHRPGLAHLERNLEI